MNKYIVVIISILLVGCATSFGKPAVTDVLNWKYGDLRIIDPIDAKNADQDLVAIYTRFSNRSFQLRIDFLDLEASHEKDLYIPLDTNAGGLKQIASDENGFLESDIDWNYLIKIPASGKIEIVDSTYSIISYVQLFIIIDTAQDRMVISFFNGNLPIYYGRTKLQVIVTPANTNTIVDKSSPFSIDAPSPSRVKVIFAFWNTFSSQTPAQALRSWAGAHAGPMSSRHGLEYLSDAADRFDSTVVLLDLLTPDSLSALDYLDALPKIRKLIDKGIIAAPIINGEIIKDANGKVLYIQSQNEIKGYLDIDKNWKMDGNLNDVMYRNKFDFSLFLDVLFNMNSEDLFVGNNDYAQYVDLTNNCDLSPNHHSVVYPSYSLSSNCKKILAISAAQQPTTPLVFGGDFSETLLGNPAPAREVFSYIKEHPWIQVLSVQDIMSYYDAMKSIHSIQFENQNVTSGQQLISDLLTDPTYISIHNALLNSPENNLTDLAWQIYASFSQPASPELIELRRNYLGQIGEILAGATWAAHPSFVKTCSTDLDYDNKNECVLANNNIFIVVEPNGGYIPFVFAKDAKGVHQIIGPTWEFTPGISDPSTWNLDLGLRGDSSQILGAFQDQFISWNNYGINLTVDGVELSSNETQTIKSISLDEDRIRIKIVEPDLSQINPAIPLIIDPWFRYTPGWGDHYIGTLSTFIYTWGIDTGELVEISSSNKINDIAFNATRAKLAFPEDPNYDYLAGHYLPFPISMVEISPSKMYTIDIHIRP